MLTTMATLDALQRPNVVVYFGFGMLSRCSVPKIVLFAASLYLVDARDTQFKAPSAAPPAALSVARATTPENLTGLMGYGYGMVRKFRQ